MGGVKLGVLVPSHASGYGTLHEHGVVLLLLTMSRKEEEVFCSEQREKRPQACGHPSRSMATAKRLRNSGGCVISVPPKETS